MSKTTLIYIVILLVLCAGSFWLGTRQVAIVESVETTVEIDSTYFDTPAPPIEVTPTEDVVVAKLAVVNYEAMKMQIVDSLVAVGWCVQKTHIPEFDNILPDSVEVSIPMSQSIFKEEGVYEIGVTGFGTTLDYAKIFNTTTTTTTTLQSPIKHWSVTANLNSFTCQGLTDISAGVGIEYSLDKWRFGGGYQIFMNGNSGVNFRIEYKILNF